MGTFEDQKEYAHAYNFWTYQYIARNSDMKKKWDEIETRLKLCPEWEDYHKDNCEHWSHIVLDAIVEESFLDEQKIGQRSPSFYQVMTDFHSIFNKNHFLPDVEIMLASEIVSRLSNGEKLQKVNSLYPQNVAILNPDSIFHLSKANVGKRVLSLDIDIDAPIKTILKEVESLVVASDTYHSAIEAGLNRDFALSQAYLEDELSSLKLFYDKNKNGFRLSSNGSRALGLWLWDYIEAVGDHSKRGVLSEAIMTMKKELGYKIAILGYAESEGRVFRNFYQKTNKCIEKRKVLSFS